MLSDSFLAKYDKINPPFGGNGLGYFVYLRTYARWIPEKKRRETWKETCKRVVEYSVSLYDGPATESQRQAEAEKMFDAMYHMRVFPSGRTMWTGGTLVSLMHGESNFNCAAVVVDNLSVFWETFYLLLLGAGVGFRILPSDVEKLPEFATDVNLIHEPYNPVDKAMRQQDTYVFYDESDSCVIVVGDSKEGWVKALEEYLSELVAMDTKEIRIVYNNVRPKGEPLKTFGGRASGHEALKDMFDCIHQVICKSSGKLEPIEVMDIMNLIGKNVVSGGVRRTAEIALFAPEDTEILDAKVDLWVKGSKNYGNDQRAMSNNSIVFEQKPEKAQLLDIFKRIVYNGEPGFYNLAAARSRRPNARVANPCGEILLDSRGMCNLCEVNLPSFVGKNGYVDLRTLKDHIRLAVRMSLRQTNITLSMENWDKIQKRDRLLGVAVSGLTDFIRKIGNTLDDYYSSHLEYSMPRILPRGVYELLYDLRIVAQEEARKYAYEMRVPEPLLVTTIKPSGTISTLPYISSGVHRHLIRYGLRRIRISSTDPLAETMRILGYPVYPEVSAGGITPMEFDQLETEEDRLQELHKAFTWVIEFPVYSGADITANEESALDQFNRYLDMQECWTDHNTSITITFSPNEIPRLVDSVLENWDHYVGVAFLPKFDIGETALPLLPQEEITRDEYIKRLEQVQYITSDVITETLQQLESISMASDLDESDCKSGVCPIR